MKERWKPAKGLESYYQVSTLGRFKSLKRESKHSRHVGVVCKRKERLFKIHNMPDQYVLVAITIFGKTIRRSLHRIVAETFIENPDNKPCVNHKNGIKSDNRIVNLEWVTFKENTLHAFNKGLLTASYGMTGKIGSKNKKSKKVKQISIISGKVIKIWHSLHCPTRSNGWDYRNLWACVVGKRPTAYGYKWEYC